MVSPTYVDNDAKAFALAEGWIGAAAGHRDFIAMVVSTGVGGGLVLDGRLLGGRLGNAGHIGHMVVVPDGRPCPCGARGCLEAWRRRAPRGGGDHRAARLASRAARRSWRGRGRLVGRAVASVVNLLDLPLAVIGGSVALGFGDPFFAAAQQRGRAFGCGLDFARDAKDGPRRTRGPWAAPHRRRMRRVAGTGGARRERTIGRARRRAQHRHWAET